MNDDPREQPARRSRGGYPAEGPMPRDLDTPPDSVVPEAADVLDVSGLDAEPPPRPRAPAGSGGPGAPGAAVDPASTAPTARHRGARRWLDRLRRRAG